MKGMNIETLKDRIIEAQLAVYEANGGSASDGELADAVLAALGLDDDTAACRLAEWLSTVGPFNGCHPENVLGHARRCLEAALTATSESEDTDG